MIKGHQGVPANNRDRELSEPHALISLYYMQLSDITQAINNMLMLVMNIPYISACEYSSGHFGLFFFLWLSDEKKNVEKTSSFGQ